MIRGKIFAADGLTWATPLIWYSVSGLTKIVLDRLYCRMYWYGIGYFLEKLGDKAAAVIVTQEEGFEMERPLLRSMRMVFQNDLCRWVDLDIVQAIGGSRGTAVQYEQAVRQAFELGQRCTTFRS